MSIAVAAVYENGLVRILEPVQLREAQKLIVLIPQDEEDHIEGHRFLAGEEIDEYFPDLNLDEPSPTLEEVRQMWSKVPGSMSDAVVEERQAKW